MTILYTSMHPRQLQATADRGGPYLIVDISGPLVGVGGPPPEPLHHLLYANGLAVTHVAIAGRFLIWDSALTVDDGAAVARAGYAVVQKLWGQLAL